jgi:hypothetical protein
MPTFSKLAQQQQAYAGVSGNNHSEINLNTNTSQRSNSTAKSVDVVHSVLDSDLKKTLMKKNKEIEGLNGECLELEDQVSIFPVVMSVLDWVCVFIREMIQRVDFVTHML